MKKLAILLISSIVLHNNTSISQKTAVNDALKGFDCELFNRALIDEMQSQFPTMRLDTTINYLLRIRSQKESGHSPIYVMKNGGMARLDENEMIQAKRLVKEYKEKLSKMGFDEKSIVNCHFTEFAALAIKNNGMVQYGLIIDNNFKYEDLGIEIEYLDE